MARKKAATKATRKKAAKPSGRATSVKTPSTRRTSTGQVVYVCDGRRREVTLPEKVSRGQRNQRYQALPEIVNSIVESCETLQEINHLDKTMLPDSEAAIRIIDVAREILFPGYFGDKSCDAENLHYHVGDRLHQLYLTLSEQIYRSVRHECRRQDEECAHCRSLAEANAQETLRRIPEVRRLLSLDVRAASDGDPAAKSFHEIILSYPGLLAISVYRLAHELFALGVPMLPRMMTEYAHMLTGIDIHPGATIGESFFIDHGTGVVIGETTVIGDNVKIYQGVTLGAMSFPKDACGKLIRGHKRHPTIEDNATIYAQATILGDTTVGRGSVIGGNVWLTADVPPDSYVTAVTPRPVVRPKRRRKGAS
jgi:serine O-acetyltransferase